jgi:glycosyltransferase involved in cell wall biosynthesis
MIEASKPAKLPVCMFTNATVRAGAENHMLDLMRRLDRCRFEICLACPAPLIDLFRGDLPGDVRTFPVSILRPTDGRAMLQFAGFLRREKVQIVHSHGFRSSLFASPIASWAGVPVAIETPHIREYWRRGWKANYAIDRMAGRYVHAYVAVSHANRRYLINEKRLPPEKITVIQNGSELEKFDPRHRPPSALRAQLGFGERDPILLLAGRLEAQKGHAVLFQALTKVLAAVPEVRLVCVGDGALRASLEAQIHELGLASCVSMVGRQSNIPDWLALADICVLPSFFEGLPLVAIECLAAGRPMIASAVDGTPEVIIDGKTGLTFPAGDPQALAAAIVRLLQAPELRAQFSNAGRRWVEQHFDIRLQVSKTERLYQQVWEKRTGHLFAPSGSPADAVFASAEGKQPELGTLTPAKANRAPLANPR